MRVLTSKESVLRFLDKISNTIIKLKYRNATEEERIKFSSELYTRRGNKVVINSVVYRKYGAMVCTGIGDNCYCDEEGNVISSDPGSENYNDNWKELIEKYAPEHLIELGKLVFESMTAITDTKNIEIEIGSEEVPLAKESGVI